MKKPKYKVGQLVKVKQLIQIKNRKIGPVFVDEMGKFCGTIIKIDSGFTNTDGMKVYKAEGWNWLPAWFAPIDTDFFTDKDFEI